MKDCPSVLCGLRQLCTGFGNDLTLPEFSEAKSSTVCDTSLVIASLEVVDNTCTALQKLMTMVNLSLLCGYLEQCFLLEVLTCIPLDYGA